MDNSEGEPLLLDAGRQSRSYSTGSLNSLREDFYPGAGRRGSARSAASLGRHSEEDADEDDQTPDELTVLQACTFIEDAVNYRSIHHRVDAGSLVIYRLYYSRATQWFLNFIIFILHILAFFEFPSSIIHTSDTRQPATRYQPPCGVTESIELFCLLVLLTDFILKSYLKGMKQFRQSRWLWAYIVIIIISLGDWCASIHYGCSEVVRIRRMFRPFFLLQHSSLMKKTVNCVRRTLPQVLSVLLLLFMHIYVFTLFGMLLFPEAATGRNSSSTNGSAPVKPNEQTLYFDNLVDSFMNLLVLLTTANNPDVTMPAYSNNRLYVIYFVVFLSIGLYCFMNMLTAVIYNQFRGYFLNSMQASLFRRRLGVRAAFEVLRRQQSPFNKIGHAIKWQGVPASHLSAAVHRSKMEEPFKSTIIDELAGLQGEDASLTAAKVHQVMAVLERNMEKEMRPEMRVIENPSLARLQTVCSHHYYTYVGCLVAFLNVVCISVELVYEFEHVRTSNNTILGVLNLVFVIYYALEQSLKIWALGWRRYIWETGNRFDGLITAVLVIVEIVYVSMYGIPFWGNEHVADHAVTLWDLVRVVNVLIMVRLFRIVTQIRAMYVVVSTLSDLVRNLKSFGGILVVIYYSYALLGIEFFRGRINYNQIPKTNSTPACGTYEQLEYWANNFDDFAAALIVLWDVMVVNNWHVFLSAYSRYVNPYSQIYFIVWWLLSVVICLNLFTALILENFIVRWDHGHQTQRERRNTVGSYTQPDFHTVHDMFRSDLREPSEDSLLVELHEHPHMIFSYS